MTGSVLGLNETLLRDKTPSDKAVIAPFCGTKANFLTRRLALISGLRHQWRSLPAENAIGKPTSRYCIATGLGVMKREIR